MKSAPSDQRLLLDLVDLDVALRRAEDARANPPQSARVKELIAQRNEQGRELVARTNQRDDQQMELARLESDIDVARKRRDRDRERLDKTAIARDARALESEIASLDARIDSLETRELEIMEALQQAEAAVAEQQALLDETTAEGQRLSAEGKAAVQRATDDVAALTRDRAAVAARIPADLLADYARIGKRAPGAGHFQQGTCGGCHMSISPRDLAALKTLADDEVAHCPECGCIMVRTAESGL
ncbi:zinc ribbon domain-containing protein [Microbacterium karelineae]|uniref:zinc ribbon domain-containing protein n=1 Tax=Microbacterium karelineae TaxID=2654283 RepID=UPI0012EACD23|nr:C4-type zinc ribbon domain-containing protein [Microbacterium karelineae]